MAVALLLIVAACSSGKSAGPASSTTTTLPPTTIPYTPVFTKGPCNDEVPANPRIECGTLTVPENRTKATGRNVVLPVAIVHTASPDPAPDPVIYFSGGPGYPGITNAERFLTKQQAGNRDIIVFDQRGTGKAEPNLDCFEMHEGISRVLGAADNPANEANLLTQALLTCRDRLRASGVDFDQYNTETTADDVADLRTAMGIKEWNLFGVSYGTTVALQVMRAHPDGVRSVTIDSVIPPDVAGGAADTVASFERVRQVFFDGCRRDAACNAAYPNLVSDFNAVIASLNATPHRSTIEDPVLHRQTPIAITGADAVAGFLNALYDTNLIPQLPNLIEQLKTPAGGAIIDQLAIQAIGFVEGVAEADAAAVMCHDRANLLRPDDDARAARDHPDYSTALLLSSFPCSDFGVAPGPRSLNEPVRSDLPTLVLGDEYDPVTPPEQSQRVSSTLSHATFVEFPGLGHGAIFAGRECPKIIFRAFLADPTAKVDTGCVASMGAPKWVLPGG